jgi:Cellulase (glycosyl hydrolase family 5)
MFVKPALLSAIILVRILIDCAPAIAMDRIALTNDGHRFVLIPSGKPFRPWGLNYGHHGRLIEDFWDTDWKTLENDFAEMKALGANVVRVHLQFGKFMDAADRPNEKSLVLLAKLLGLSERVGLYLDLTGLACYRKADVPAWYDALSDEGRWSAQERFWEAVADRCHRSPAVFCYDFINEPFVPGGPRKPGDWYSGRPLGGYDFVQFIALDSKGKPREELARQWTAAMAKATRRRDPSRLVTVGMLPWMPQWGFLSGFVPEKIAPDVDLISVHVYPEKGKVDEAVQMLKKFSVGKPLVVEETFPLSCGIVELEDFIKRSDFASGWLGHYDGQPPDELKQLRATGTLSISQALWLDWLELFQKLGPKERGR